MCPPLELLEQWKKQNFYPPPKLSELLQADKDDHTIVMTITSSVECAK